MAVLPEFMLGATVAIGEPDSSGVGGPPRWCGTGFIYFWVTGPSSAGDTRSTGHAYLVTNKHVLEPMNSLVLKVDKPSGGSHVFDLDLYRPDGTSHSIGHADPEIDVAVVPIALDRAQAICGGDLATFHSVQSCRMLKSDLADHRVFEGDSVFAVGFPLGMVGAEQNVPIVRGGVIARISDMLRGDSKFFLVDAEVFPGNSGGPVILRPSIMSVGGTPTNDRALLIGMVASYVPYRDVAVSIQTGVQRITFDENTGLTLAYPIDAVEETIKLHLASVPADPSPAEAPDEIEDSPPA